jgi:phospholipid/cholesterol/gamma-HCH transport system ATP-binding protein
MKVIEVINFRKVFGTKVVHADVNFHVKKGECLGLIGGSGCGKSVLLRSLIGLEKPNSGQVFIFGNDIVPLGEEELTPVRQKVAYAFQGGALFDSLSVYDNLAYPLREHTQMTESEISERIREVLGEFGLLGNEQLYPAELSGGMQKRVGVARAIIIKPDIILYDEPTAGLDPYNTRKIQEMILELKKQGVTSILVTHDMPTAFEVCDRISLLLKGKIAAEGTKAELDASPGGVIHNFIHGREV